MLRVRSISQGWTGSPGFSTFYFSPSSESPSDATEVVDCVRAFYAYAVEYLPSGVTYTPQLEVDVVNPATGAVTNTLIAASLSTPIAGTKPGSILPPSNMAVVTFNTETFIAGRRVRGRSFLGPLSQTETIDGSGRLASAAYGRYIAAGDRLLATGGAPSLVVWHRPKNGSGGDTAPVVSFACSPKLGVLRSRRD